MILNESKEIIKNEKRFQINYKYIYIILNNYFW